MSGSGYIVLWRVNLTGKHMSTGKTTHYRGDGVLPRPQSLLIAQYLDDDGYYLLYLDEHQDELTDTYHNDVAAAMAQADWEFGVKAAEWEKVAH